MLQSKLLIIMTYSCEQGLQNSKFMTLFCSNKSTIYFFFFAFYSDITVEERLNYLLQLPVCQRLITAFCSNIPRKVSVQKTEKYREDLKHSVNVMTFKSKSRNLSNYFFCKFCSRTLSESSNRVNTVRTSADYSGWKKYIQQEQDLSSSRV